VELVRGGKGKKTRKVQTSVIKADPKSGKRRNGGGGADTKEGIREGAKRGEGPRLDECMVKVNLQPERN